MPTVGLCVFRFSLLDRPQNAPGRHRYLRHHAAQCIRYGTGNGGHGDDDRAPR